VRKLAIPYAKVVRQLAKQFDFCLVEGIGLGRGHCQRAEHLAFHA
jgi:hypothetical protein